MLIAPSEPVAIKRLGQTSSIPETFGVDIMWIARGKIWGVQRKQFPGDFLSSLYDGRLHKEVHQIRGLTGAGLLVVEGYGEWQPEGKLVDRREFTREQMYGLLASFQLVYGITVIRVVDTAETVDCVRALHRWSLKNEHLSMEGRPAPTGGMWGRATSKDWSLHLLTSFPGIGPKVAEAIYDQFGGVPLAWTVTEEELREVKGVGRGRARKLLEALRSDQR